MRTFIVVGAMVVAMAGSAHARITAEDVQAIATATANEIESRGGVSCNGGGTATAVVDPAAPTYVTGPKVFQKCKMYRDGHCEPTRVFFKAVE